MTPETTSLGSPDLTLQECCERWSVSSRNSVKARAAALGVELRRESSTRTVWPREDVPLGDELHDHLQSGGTLRDFPGALPQPPKPSAIAPHQPAAVTAATGGSDELALHHQSMPGALAPAQPAAVTAAAGGSDAMALAMLQLLQQQAPAGAGPLARSRGMAAAADERLPLTTGELAELVGLDQEELAGLQTGNVLYGFKLSRIGRSPGKDKEGNPKPDRRAWMLSRMAEASDDSEEGVTAITALPAATAAKRAPGFVACLDAEAVVMSRLELPSW